MEQKTKPSRREVVIPKDITKLMGVSLPTAYARISRYKEALKIENPLPELPISAFCKLTGFNEETVRARMVA